MKKGRPLRRGDTIGVVAPASPATEAQVYLGKEKLEHLGFNVKLGESCFTDYGGYLAGTPEARSRDVNNMFLDPEVDAIMCLRGGYGTPQILQLLDYDCISSNPKLFIGYSDITAIHTAIRQKTELVTLHGPMLASDLAHDFHDFSLRSLFKTVMQQSPLGQLENPEGKAINCLVSGRIQGQLVGGNLSLIAATLGTPYELDTKDKILFLEDVGEEPYRIDRMLTQLALARKLEEAAGFVLGDWTDCESTNYADGFTVFDLWEKMIAPFGKPTIYNVMAGHCKPTLTLPLGVDVTLDASNKQLIVEESVVTDVE